MGSSASRQAGALLVASSLAKPNNAESRRRKKEWFFAFAGVFGITHSTGAVCLVRTPVLKQKSGNASAASDHTILALLELLSREPGCTASRETGKQR